MANTLKLGAGKWATGTDTVLAFNDENNNFKPLPFDFSRASSATVVNQSGLIETVGSGTPRIDFKDNTKGALLLEPQRINAITNSDSFGSTGWGFVTTGTAIAPIVTDDYAISPDGTQNAQRVQFNLGGGSPSRTVIRQSLSTQTDWVLSVWMKSTDGTEQKILWHSTSDTNETIVTGEWKRFTFSRNGLSNSWAGLCLNAGVSSVDTADILVYGFQAEQGSYATSYIPTSGSAVTRVAESTSQTVPDGVIGQTEGTMFIDFNIDGDISGNRSVAVLSSGGSADFVASFIFNNLFYARIRANNGSLVDVTKSNLTSGNHKIAIAYASNDLTFYLDGVLVGQNTSASVSFGSKLSTIKIGESTSGTAELGGLVSKTSLYNTRLSNAELQALTT